MTVHSAVKRSSARRDDADNDEQSPRETRSDSDAELLHLVEQGKINEAMCRLVQLHGNAVHQLCRRMLGDAVLADDVQQQVFLDATCAIGRFQPRSSLRAWLLAIARHRILDTTKSHRRRWAWLSSADLSNEPDPRPSAAESVDARLLQEALADSLDELNPNLRVLLLLRYQQDLSYEEISLVMDVKADTLQQRVSRALPRLRLSIETRIGDPVIKQNAVVARYEGMKNSRRHMQLVDSAAEQSTRRDVSINDDTGHGQPTTPKKVDFPLRDDAAETEVLPVPRSRNRNVILFLAANPQNTDPLSLSEECAEIQRELKMAANRDDFCFESRWAINVDEFMRHLTELDPAVLHFSGHGRKSTGLIFQDSRGLPQTVSAAAIAMMVAAAARNLRVVLLNACHSSALARELSDKVDCIVSMNGAINDDAARAFAMRFYGALGNGRSVGNAVEHGIAALAAKQLSDAVLPECVTRNGISAHDVILTSTAGARRAAKPTKSRGRS